MTQKSPGETIEYQTLESAQGGKVSIPHSSDLTHLQFRRFAGCPICNLHMQSFIRRHDELVGHKIQEIAVFYSDKNALSKYSSLAPFAIIADPDKSLYRSFGVGSSIWSVLNFKALAAAVKGVINYGAGLPAKGESPFGLPADFLIDNKGRILASKYGSHAYDQWEVDDVLKLASNVY